MKRFISVLLAGVFLILSLSACEKRDPSENLPEKEFTTAGFLECLDRENFKKDVTQTAFLDQVDKYSYRGRKVTDLALPAYFDGVHGGGIMGWGDFLGIHNEYYADDEKITYTNEIDTLVPLDGLVLPYDIKFDDSIQTVFKKIGIKEDLDKAFEPNQTSVTEKTLFENKTEALILIKHNTYTESDNKYSYSLKYTETESAIEGERDEITVRSVEMSFSRNNALSRFKMSVVQTRENPNQ